MKLLIPSSLIQCPLNNHNGKTLTKPDLMPSVLPDNQSNKSIHSTIQPTNPSINKSINQPTNQPIYQSSSSTSPKIPTCRYYIMVQQKLPPATAPKPRHRPPNLLSLRQERLCVILGNRGLHHLVGSGFRDPESSRLFCNKKDNQINDQLLSYYNYESMRFIILYNWVMFHIYIYMQHS